MSTFTRRSFLAMSAALPFAVNAFASSSVPMGIEMYSVRDGLKQDPEGTVRAVAHMGYAGVEFYAPYFDWSEDQTKQMRKLMDDLGIRCYSTHNDAKFLAPDNIQKTQDRNLMLDSKIAVMSNAGEVSGLDGWKGVADKLNAAADKLAPAGLRTGYHNHQPEWTRIGNQRPMDVLAKNTKPSVVLQLDVGTCVEMGADPVAWIRSNPGRIRSIHCKDWSPDPAKSYAVLFGEGNAPWKGIFEAAESVGGVEYYLMEQEGSRYSELETAKKCLEAYRHGRGF